MDKRAKRNITQAVMFAGLSAIKIRKRRSVWVKKYREKFGHLPLIQELRENHPDDFKNNLRMDSEAYYLLLNKIKHKVTKQDTIMRQSIGAEARLAATLRYLATGRSFEDLKYSTGISAPSLSKIIPETCRAIYTSLQPDYLKMPSSKEDWKRVAEEFQSKWQFINCGGAIDGKHIRIVPAPDSGATFYNYKNFYSIILMALVGPNYEFLYVDVGKNGRISDGGVFEYTEFNRKLKMKHLNLPENYETVNNYNFMFVGDEAFALEENFLKPYAQRELDYEKRIYNYRLSRARNVVENAFGIISSRFRVLHTAINIKHQNICYVVLAICALHNFLGAQSSSYFSANVDKEDVSTGTVQLGEWRQTTQQLTNLQRRQHVQITSEAKQNRENYKKYFNSEGKVEWQDYVCKWTNLAEGYYRKNYSQQWIRTNMT